MPEFPRYEKKACWRCRFYKLGDADGPFCAYFKIVFPDYKAWTRDKTATKPGERVCKHWKGRGGINEANEKEHKTKKNIKKRTSAGRASKGRKKKAHEGEPPAF